VHGASIRIVDQLPAPRQQAAREITVFTVRAHGFIVAPNVQHRGLTKEVIAPKKKSRIANPRGSPFLSHVGTAPAVGNRNLDAFGKRTADSSDLAILQLRRKVGEPMWIGNAIRIEGGNELAACRAERSIASGRQPPVPFVTN
jgi:hypothetical protein